MSILFLGVPWRGLYWIGLAVWGTSAAVVVLHPRSEDLLARAGTSAPGAGGVGVSAARPGLWAVCTAAGVDPDRYRVWLHDRPQATAPITPGATVAVTS